jgi:uncharacterized protein YndB with AHSA1/START domain
VRPIQVSVDVAAPIERVWERISDIATHPEWMADALAVRFTSPTTRGVGTTFDCDTRIGPFRLTDPMEVTEWEDGRAIAIRHAGVVAGEGRMVLSSVPTGTRVVWTERLRFPWWQGGSATVVAARPVLRRIWSANLERLRDLIERG